MACGGNGHRDAEHRADPPGAARPARVQHPLRLECPARRPHAIGAAAPLDPLDRAVLEEIDRGVTRRRDGDVARHNRRMHVAVVRGVGRAEQMLPIEGGEHLAARRGVQPLILHAAGTPQRDEIEEGGALRLRLREHEVARLGETAVEPEFVAEAEIEFARPLAEFDRRLRAALLPDDARRPARRAEPRPLPLADRDPPESARG